MSKEEMEEISEIIEEIRPVANFTKDMFDGFMMAKTSIKIELGKYFSQFKDIMEQLELKDKDNDEEMST